MIGMHKYVSMIPVLLSAFVLLNGCQSSSKEGGQTANDQQSNGSVNTEVIKNPEGEEAAFPEISFEKSEHDFGKVTKGEKVAHSFKFSNEGNAPLVISNANPSCGCTVPNIPEKPIQPGESAFIDVVFDSEGRDGKFNKSITVMANNQGEPRKLYIKGSIVR